MNSKHTETNHKWWTEAMQCICMLVSMWGFFINSSIQFYRNLNQIKIVWMNLKAIFLKLFGFVGNNYSRQARNILDNDTWTIAPISRIFIPAIALQIQLSDENKIIYTRKSLFCPILVQHFLKESFPKMENAWTFCHLLCFEAIEKTVEEI